MSVDAIDVAGYAAAVRRALAGLGPEQIEDLTDGLEADLAEALADEATAGRGADPVARFGTPEEYAAELAAAAGLAPETAPRTRAVPMWLGHPWRSLAQGGRGVVARLRRHAWWPPVERFLVAVRPAWWVLRGWVVYQLARQIAGASHAVLPHTVVTWALLLVLVVASVQWGRGSWRLPHRFQWLPMAVSAIAAIAALPIAAVVSAGPTQYVSTAFALPGNGVWVGGQQATNLFVYDAAGNPLDDVQIYDDQGRPVLLTDDRGYGEWSVPGADRPWTFVGTSDVNGRTLWNVYPRRGAPSDRFLVDSLTGEPSLPLGVAPQSPPRPFGQTSAIVVPSAAPTAQAVPDEAATPTSGATAAVPQPEPTAAGAAPASANPTPTP